LLLIVNYLVMAMALSLNTGAIGAPDELQNRPLVWAYFGLVSWTSGAAYALAFGNDVPRPPAVRASVILLVLSTFAIPWRFGRDLQTLPAWPGFASFHEFASFPSCLVRAAQYIRRHSQSGDVIQDSKNDTHMLVGALAERDEFANDWISDVSSKELKGRLSGIGAFNAATSEASLTAFASTNKIAWQLLRPESRVSWPESKRRNFSFDCDGYRVYHFPKSSPSIGSSAAKVGSPSQH
jgi:hypothetical protein